MTLFTEDAGTALFESLSPPMPVLLRFKKLHPEAVLPTRAREGDAGLDLVATSVTWDHQNHCLTIGTGVAVAIPEGYVGLLFPRSSVYKSASSMANSVGVIDAGYRGEIKAVFRRHYGQGEHYVAGDRVCQLVVVPIATFMPTWSDDLGGTERGECGFGSSGT